MYEIKKLQISSLARITGIASGLLGLIPTVFGLLSFLVIEGRATSYYDSFPTDRLIFFLLIPLFSALIGYIYGAVVAFIYNLIVPYVGGVRMEIELIEENK